MTHRTSATHHLHSQALEIAEHLNGPFNASQTIMDIKRNEMPLSHASFEALYFRPSAFEVCRRCSGYGHIAYDVAPIITPVASLPLQATLADVTVPCDACSGTGLSRV